MKILGQVLVCLALAGASGAAAAAPAAAPADAAYLSFAELYRLTVSGSAVDFNAAPDGAGSAAAESASAGASAKPVSISSAAPQPAPAIYTISSVSLPEPTSRWLLVLSAFALAAWVARRRLGF